MVRIREAILVEGRYDKNTLSQVVDTLIIEAGGFRIMKDRETVGLLKKVAERQGLIILTDSDGAGFVIRNKLKGLLPKENVLHAYIPEIAGKEKRKQKPGKAGILGVEGMTPEIILRALKNAGAHLEDQEPDEKLQSITRQDLYELGLTGRENSSALRLALTKKLELPSGLNAKALLEVLNMLTTRAELVRMLDEIKHDINDSEQGDI